MLGRGLFKRTCDVDDPDYEFVVVGRHSKGRFGMSCDISIVTPFTNFIRSAVMVTSIILTS